jgi:glutaconate CoA-transferase subunit B
MSVDKTTGKLRVVKLMPEVSLERVQENTGFRVGAASQVSTVELPTAEELNILRQEVDPAKEYLGKDKD